MQTMPASIGDRAEDLETPFLVVDLEALDANVDRMANEARAAGMRLRPHAKTHRCPAIAARQVAAGAVGVCAQTVGEAEALVAGGITDVLLTNEIVAVGKLRRLAALAEHATIALLCDSPEGVRAASQAAQERGVTLGVLVEVDVGMGRCGVAPGRPACDLAGLVAEAPHLAFRGLQAYHGRAQHFPRYAERERAIADAAEAVRQTVAALRDAGLPCETVSGAGTGTYGLEAASGLWTELQAGSYIFMDREYAEIEGPPGQAGVPFQHSLFVLASIISMAGGRAIADAGLKSFSAEKGLPLLHGVPGAQIVGVSDEHSVISLGPDVDRLCLGQQVRLLPGHCDPTVNLHDWIVGLRQGRVEEIWPVSARGASR